VLECSILVEFARSHVLYTPLGMEVGLGPGNIVLDGDPAPPFLAHRYCGQTAVCIRIALDMEVDLSLGDIVFDVDPAPPLLKDTAP